MKMHKVKKYKGKAIIEGELERLNINRYIDRSTFPPEGISSTIEIEIKNLNLLKEFRPTKEDESWIGVYTKITIEVFPNKPK